MQGSDLFALTSHSENFGIAILEALASGTPVMITTGVALKDLVKEQNLGWVAELKVKAIASAIQEFLDHPEMARQMGNRAIQYVAEHYTPSIVAHSLMATYTQILDLN